VKTNFTILPYISLVFPVHPTFIANILSHLSQFRSASVDEDTIHHYRIVAKQEATQKLHALRDEAGLDRYGSSLVVLHGDPTMRIIEQEQEWGCDLIVMGKHGENLLEELLIGSVTKHVLAESQCDILISV